MSPSMIRYLSFILLLMAVRNISESTRGILMEDRPLTPSELIFKIITVVMIIMYLESYSKVYNNLG